jgi:hypothetical protein
MFKVEPRTDVNRRQFHRGKIRDPLCQPPCTAEVSVMNHHGNAVRRKPDIEFQPIGPVKQGTFESGDGVFGCKSRSSAVADYKRKWHYSDG